MMMTTRVHIASNPVARPARRVVGSTKGTKRQQPLRVHRNAAFMTTTTTTSRSHTVVVRAEGGDARGSDAAFDGFSTAPSEADAARIGEMVGEIKDYLKLL
jgi:hypothetical protein